MENAFSALRFLCKQMTLLNFYNEIPVRGTML